MKLISSEKYNIVHVRNIVHNFLLESREIVQQNSVLFKLYIFNSEYDAEFLIYPVH